MISPVPAGVPALRLDYCGETSRHGGDEVLQNVGVVVRDPADLSFDDARFLALSKFLTFRQFKIRDSRSSARKVCDAPLLLGLAAIDGILLSCWCSQADTVWLPGRRLGRDHGQRSSHLGHGLCDQNSAASLIQQQASVPHL